MELPLHLVKNPITEQIS